MAYLLRLTTNGYAQLASTFSVASASSLSVKFKASFTGVSEIYGVNTNTSERLQYNGSGFFFRLGGTNGNTITTATIASLVSGYNVANPHEYELRKIPFEDGTRTKYRLFVEGVDCGELMSIYNSGGATFQFSRIGSASTGFFNGDLYYMDCYVDGVKTRSYDPSATGGSGSTLVDTTGGQNGTLNGTYSWVFYGTGGGTSWEGTVGKTTLSTTTKALLLSLGYSSTPSKQSLTITPKSDTISAGYINVLNKGAETVDYKQLAVIAGTSVPFIATLNKTSYALSSKQLDVSAGYLSLLGKQNLAVTTYPLDVITGSNVPFSGSIGKSSYILDGKQLSVALGFNSGGNKQSLSLSNYQQQLSAGFIDDIQELSLTLDGKPFSVTTGTEVSFVGVLNKSSLNALGKPLSVSAGTVIPFNGSLQKTSLTLTGKQLSTVRGQILEIQKDALDIVQKQLSAGETIYPIIPIERLFTLKDGDRTYVLKQKTTVYLIKNK